MSHSLSSRRHLLCVTVAIWSLVCCPLSLRAATAEDLHHDAHAFILDQQGLMASLSIEGSKISRIHR